MGLKRKALSLTAAATLASALLGGPIHAAAGSIAWCNDGDTTTYDVPLWQGGFGVPLWLGIETGAFNGYPGHVAICASETPPGSTSPETFGGGSFVNVDAPYNGPYVFTAGTQSDSGAAVQANTYTDANPTLTAQSGGTSGGQQLTVSIPVAVCAGVCYPAPIPGAGLSTTGAIVGTIQQVPAPSGGQSAAYQLTGLCLVVDGIQDCLAGPAIGATTGTLPALVVDSGGPCLNGLCLPFTGSSTIGVTPAQVATVYLPDMAPIPVDTGGVCYQSTTQSPPCT
jgi:hypothetical protein